MKGNVRKEIREEGPQYNREKVEKKWIEEKGRDSERGGIRKGKQKK